MKKLLQGWNLRRALYLIGGSWMVVQSLMDRLWILVPFGLYFVVMAVFNLGCASGNCEVTSPEKDT